MQITRIVAALVDLGYPKSYQTEGAGPVRWLDEVKEGFGTRYGAAFASEGFEDADDLKFSCPTQQMLESILKQGGAAKPQVERITAALVKLTGTPLQQQQSNESLLPCSSYFGAAESPLPLVEAVAAGGAGSRTESSKAKLFANTPAKPLVQTNANALPEHRHLEILRERSTALADSIVAEEPREQDINRTALTRWTGRGNFKVHTGLPGSAYVQH